MWVLLLLGLTDQRCLTGPPPALRLDLHGDSLPADAIVRMGSIRLRHQGAVYAVAFLPDSETLASGGADRVVRLWDVASGKSLGTLHRHANSIRTLAVAANGKVLASGGDDAVVYLWDPATGKLIHELRGHSLSVESVAFTPDGKYVLSGGNDMTVRVWNVANGEQRLLYKLAGKSVRAVAYAPDGSRFLAATEASIQLWELATGKELTRIDTATDRLDSAAFAPDGKRVVTMDQDGQLVFWDIASGKEVQRSKGLAGGSFSFSPSGNKLAAAGANRMVQVLNPADRQTLQRFEGHTGRIHGVAFSPDGRLVASAGADGTVGLWSLATGRAHLPLTAHSGAITTIAFGMGGKRLITHGGDVRIWDAAAGRLLHQIEHVDRRTRPGIHGMAVSPDGRWIATSAGETPRLWETETGAEQRKWHWRSGAGYQTLSFSPDSKYLAMIGDYSFRLLDVATGKEQDNPPQGITGGRYTAVALSDRSVWLAAESSRGAPRRDEERYALQLRQKSPPRRHRKAGSPFQ